MQLTAIPGRTFDPRPLVATVSDSERTIAERRAWEEDRKDFREFRALMQSNRTCNL